MENVQELSWKERLIDFFRSEIFVLCTFVAITVPLMWHTAHLLLKVSDINNEFYAWFFAFGFDLAIFTFAINGRKGEATGLAFGVFVLNCAFFNLGTMYAYFGAETVVAQMMVRLVVTVIISAMGSYIVHSYVVFFNDKIEGKDKYMELIKEYDLLNNKNNELIREARGFNDLKVQLGVVTEKLKQAEKSSTDLKLENEILKSGPILTEVKDKSAKLACGVTGCFNKADNKQAFENMKNHCINKNCLKETNQIKQPLNMAVNG